MKSLLQQNPELAILRELRRIVQRPEAVVTQYRRVALGLALASLAGIGLSAFLLTQQLVSDAAGALIAALAGIVGGLSFYCRASADQTPYFIRYFDPRMDEIIARIRELERAAEPGATDNPDDAQR